jgi:hypothetical protein
VESVTFSPVSSHYHTETEVSHSQGCPVGYLCLVVHNRSAVGFVVLHFVSMILDLNVEYVFLCTCELRANFGRFVTADYFSGFVFLFSTSPRESSGWKNKSV